MSTVVIPKTTPYDAAISEVQAKIEDLKTTLSTLLRLQAEYSGTGYAPIGRADTEISHDTFFGMTIGDAAKKYLAMMKATKPTADIADALERGGLKHSSKDFATTVRSVLGPREDFLRVPNGDWGLSEWYPGQGRGKKVKNEKTPKQKPAPEAEEQKEKVDGPTRKERILQIMGTNQEKAWTASEIAKAICDNRRYIQATLTLLVQDGRLVKDPGEGYRIAVEH